MGGGFGQMIEDLYQKFNVEAGEQFNPTKIIKIILADDDILSNLALRNMIEQGGGYQVFQFYNGMDACTFYEERGEEISSIIMDVEMPERNGIEATEWIRNYENIRQKDRVPIIGLTGHENQEIQDICLHAGMNQVLTKPIKKATVLDMLKKIIK